jgi:SAM-dependent methyltransferase
LPATNDREGYYGPDHFSYWASGLLDTRHLLAAAAEHGVAVNDYLDFGCASGRVLRHMALERPEARVLGCDINRLHVEWCNAYMPSNCSVFQNHSVPNLPLPDSSVDVVSAYSVFTHIEALETAWLMELRRILRPGGIAWITVHSELTLQEMTHAWPLWKPVMEHPHAAQVLDKSRNFRGDRFPLRRAWTGAIPRCGIFNSINQHHADSGSRVARRRPTSGACSGSQCSRDIYTSSGEIPLI